MPATPLGLLGTGSATTAGTTLAVTNTTGAVIPAGTLVHICGAWDNINSVTAPTITCSAVGGGTAVANHATAIGSGITTTAGAGVWHQCFRVLTTGTIAIGGTIATLTSNQSAVKRAAAAVGYSGVTTTLRGTVATGTSTTGSPSATTTGTALVTGDLVIGSASFENNAQMTADADTTNGSWPPIVGTFTTGGGAATNVGVATQDKVVTATGAQTFNPTGGVADSVACVYSLVPAASSYTPSPNDPVGVTDARTPVQDNLRSPSDAVGVTDSVSAVFANVANMVDWKAGVYAETPGFTPPADGGTLVTAAADLVSGTWALDASPGWRTSMGGTGKPAFLFPSGNARLTKTSPSWTDTTVGTLCVIGKLTTGVGDFFDGDATNRRLLDGNGGQWRTYANSSIVAGGTTDTGVHLFFVEFRASGNEVLYVDNTAIATADGGAGVNPAALVIGSSQNGEHLGSEVAFAGYVDRILTSTERDAIYAWYQGAYVGTAPIERNPSDSVGVTDAGDRVLEAVRTPSDTVGATDAAQATQDMQRAPADTVGVTDSATALLSKEISTNDPVGVSDAAVISAEALRSPSDAVGVSDAGTIAFEAFRALADQVGVTDVASVTGIALRDTGDQVGATDALVLERTKTSADAVGAADSVQLTRDIVLTSPVSVTDEAIVELVGVAYEDDPQDDVDVTDQVVLSRGLTVGDVAGVTDSLTIERSISAADAVGVTDARSLQRELGISDSVGVTDAAARVQAQVVTAADDVGVTDSTAVSGGGIVTDDDAVGITDEATAAQGLARVSSDPVGVSDDAQVAIAYAHMHGDTVGATDQLEVQQVIEVLVQDSVGVTDEAETSAAGDTELELDDVVTLTDSVTVVMHRVVQIDELVGASDQASTAALLEVLAEDQVGITDDVPGFGLPAVDYTRAHIVFITQPRRYIVGVPQPQRHVVFLEQPRRHVVGVSPPVSHIV